MKNLSLYVNLSNYSPFDTLRFKMLILRWKLLKATVIRVILSLEESRVPVLLAPDEPVCLQEPRLFHYSEFLSRTVVRVALAVCTWRGRVSRQARLCACLAIARAIVPDLFAVIWRQTVPGHARIIALRRFSSRCSSTVRKSIEIKSTKDKSSPERDSSCNDG